MTFRVREVTKDTYFAPDDDIVIGNWLIDGHEIVHPTQVHYNPPVQRDLWPKKHYSDLMTILRVRDISTSAAAILLRVLIEEILCAVVPQKGLKIEDRLNEFQNATACTKALRDAIGHIHSIGSLHAHKNVLRSPSELTQDEYKDSKYSMTRGEFDIVLDSFYIIAREVIEAPKSLEKLERKASQLKSHAAQNKKKDN